MRNFNGNTIRDKIRSDLKNASIQIPDVTYALPDPNWVSGKLHFKLFQSWLWENEMNTWKEYWDSDNFAVLFYIFAQLCHAKTMKFREQKGMTTTQGLGIGIVFFQQEGVGGHAINFVVTKDGLKFLEPQNGRYLQLSKKERDSAWFVMC